jgi:hypothetical protein
MEKKDKFMNPNPVLVEKYRKKFESLDKNKKKEVISALGSVFLTDNIEKNTREKIQSSLKFNDRVTLLLAFIGIITNVVASSIYITFSTSFSKYLS